MHIRRPSIEAWLAISLMGLSACAPQAQAPATVTPTFQAVQARRSLPAPFQTKPAPTAEVRLIPNPQIPKTMTAVFQITMPRLRPEGFATQAIATNAINWVKLEVSGIGIAVPLPASGADAQGLNANPGGTFTLSVPGIPYLKLSNPPLFEVVRDRRILTAKHDS